MATITKTKLTLKKKQDLTVSSRGINYPMSNDKNKSLTVSFTNVGDEGLLRIDFTIEEAKSLIESFNHYIAKYSL